MKNLSGMPLQIAAAISTIFGLAFVCAELLGFSWILANAVALAIVVASILGRVVWTRIRLSAKRAERSV